MALGARIQIGDGDWGLRLEIGIGYWDWGLGLGFDIGIREGNGEWDEWGFVPKNLNKGYW